jgi:hypothetical protein
MKRTWTITITAEALLVRRLMLASSPSQTTNSNQKNEDTNPSRRLDCSCDHERVS